MRRLWLLALLLALLPSHAAGHSAQNMTISSQSESFLKFERSSQGDRWSLNMACRALPAVSQSSRMTLACDSNDNLLKLSINGGAYQEVGAGGGGAGITSMNGETDALQTFEVDSVGSDFAITSAAGTHTWHLPDAAPDVRGVVNFGTQTIDGDKTLSGVTTIGTDLVCTDCITLETETIGEYVTGLAPDGGLATFGSEAKTMGLQDCADGQVLKASASPFEWACASDQLGEAGSGITTLNALTATTQTFSTADTCTDFEITSTTDDHEFCIPDASDTARGLVSTGNQTFEGAKNFGGAIAFEPSSISLAANNTTLGFTSNFMKVTNTSGDDLVMISEPHLLNAPNDGTIGILAVLSADSVTFEDESDLPGSNMELFNNESVTLANGQAMTLMYTGGKWWQVGGSIVGVMSINGLPGVHQFLDNGNAGTSPNWSSFGATHVLNIPNAGIGIDQGGVTDVAQGFAGDKSFLGDTDFVQTISIVPTLVLIDATDDEIPTTDSSLIQVSNITGSPMVLDGTPTIGAPEDDANGTLIFVVNESAFSLTFQDDDDEPDTNIQLFGNTSRTVTENEGILFRWDSSANIWEEIALGGGGEGGGATISWVDTFDLPAIATEPVVIVKEGPTMEFSEDFDQTLMIDVDPDLEWTLTQADIESAGGLSISTIPTNFLFKANDFILQEGDEPSGFNWANQMNGEMVNDRLNAEIGAPFACVRVRNVTVTVYDDSNPERAPLPDLSGQNVTVRFSKNFVEDLDVAATVLSNTDYVASLDLPNQIPAKNISWAVGDRIAMHLMCIGCVSEIAYDFLVTVGCR